MMATANDNSLDLDCLDDIPQLDKFELDLLHDILAEEFDLSDLLQAIPIQTPTPSSEIPVNPKDWLVTDKVSKRQRPPWLYEFLLLLLQKREYISYASYKDISKGIFEVHEPEKIAHLWQQIKSRQSNKEMTYDKFARAVRCYYKEGTMLKTNTRYTFQFSPKLMEQLCVDENNNMEMDYQ
ncbi:hypothetical protein I4U23_001227 [Adineta vaga]|nr:hypothetical protein I4U23_001227 [Adineta vaga]